jgi:hypothetical protein
MIESLADRVRWLQTVATRVTPASLAVRGAIFLGALTAFALAYPPQILLSGAGGLLLIAATLPAVSPRAVWATVAALLAVAGWVLSTSGYGEPIALWRLLGLAAFLYLTHSLCALAAMLPYDAVVGPEVLARWVSRAVAVVLVSAVFGIVLLAVPGTGGRGDLLVAVLAGLAAAVGASALLAWLLRR